MIIAFEGIDGSGKATQAKMLAERIGAKLFSFPNYETETGKLILDNLQQRWVAAVQKAVPGAPPGFPTLSVYGPMVRANALVLQSLFTVNRYEMADEIMDACVEDGDHVVLDRYWLSGVVYGACDGLDEEWLTRIHSSLPPPDVWILLDVDPAESIKRRPERRDRYEKDANMGRRREIYRRIFNDYVSDTVPVLVGENSIDYLTKWCVVDGAGPVEVVHQRVMDLLKARGLL